MIKRGLPPRKHVSGVLTVVGRGEVQLSERLAVGGKPEPSQLGGDHCAGCSGHCRDRGGLRARGQDSGGVSTRDACRRGKAKGGPRAKGEGAFFSHSHFNFNLSIYISLSLSLAS